MFARFCLSWLLLGLAGCAAPLQSVYVDAIADPQAAPPKTFVIAPGDKDVPATDLQFREYAAQLERALASRGYQKAARPQDAAMQVALSYGVAGPHHQTRVWDEPVYGVTGIWPVPVTTVGPGGATVVTIVGSPSYGVTGWTPVARDEVRYTRYLTAVAFDLTGARRGDGPQLWKTTVTSSGRSSDLRVAFPYLVYAAAPYFGTNTGKRIEIRLQAGDPGVAYYQPAAQKAQEAGAVQ